MKATKQQIKDILLNELDTMVNSGELDEGLLDRLRYKTGGAGEKLGRLKRSAVQKLSKKVHQSAGDEEQAARLKDLSRQDKLQTSARIQQQKIGKLLGKKMDRIELVVADLSSDVNKLNIDQDPRIKKALGVMTMAMANLEALFWEIESGSVDSDDIRLPAPNQDEEQ